MNLIDKFEAIEVDKVNIIPDEDMRFCEKHFNFYSKSYKYFEKHLIKILELEREQDDILNESYLYESSGIGSRVTTQEMVRLTKSFIYKTCAYFTDKYKITINQKLIPSSEDIYGSIPRFCELNEILDNIIDTLGGFDFREKAIQELKEKTKTERFYYEWKKTFNYDVKGKIIKFRFNANISNIRQGLYFYDNNEEEIIDYYTNNKIDYEKRFDNGHVDICFKKAQYASEFSRKYLGYDVNEKK